MRDILWRTLMLNKLKKKYIILASVLMTCLMAVLILIMSILNYTSMVSESDTVLDILSKPSAPFLDEEKFREFKPGEIRDFLPRGISPEMPYESRYFSTVVLEDGTVTDASMSRIVSVDSEKAKEYTELALKKNRDSGFIDEFRYKVITDDRVTRVIFLDCGRRIESFYTSLWISLAVGAFGCLTVFLILLLGTGKMIRPIAESYEKQKRFISDAGHEIKTPLTIISANLDLIEDDYPQVEEMSDIRQQVDRLKNLTNNLVYLSRLEETEKNIKKTEFSVSETAGEVAEEFVSLAEAQNKEYTVNIQPGVSFEGSEEEIRKLISVLLDNAFKYSPEKGTVSVNMYTEKNAVVLSVFNTASGTVDTRSMSYVFDRFYRTDSSRNSQTGGHGIGLSMAKAITEAHSGTIRAETKTGSDFIITAVLPL